MSDKNNRPTIVTKDSRGRAEVRRYAFPSVEVSAIGVASALEVVSAGESEVCLVSITVSDTTNADERASFCIVDAGGVPSAANIAIQNWKVGAHSIGEVEIMLNPGQSLYVYATAANSIRVSGWITAYL